MVSHLVAGPSHRFSFAGPRIFSGGVAALYYRAAFRVSGPETAQFLQVPDTPRPSDPKAQSRSRDVLLRANQPADADAGAARERFPCAAGPKRSGSNASAERRLAHFVQAPLALALVLSGLLAQTPPLKPFSHKKHLAIGNIAPILAAAIDKGTYLGNPGDIRRHLNTTNPCAACHRGMEDSDRVSKINMPQMADCLVCHSKIDPPDSCTFCHVAGAKFRPASHTSDFLDKHKCKAAGREFLWRRHFV